MATSEYAAQEIRADNRDPRFDRAPSISVKENTPAGTAIGNPVVARDDDGDKLTYTLVMSDDAEAFNINWATGQLMLKEALDFEMPADADMDNMYSVMVKATDPAGVPSSSGNENSATATVIITVTGVNEPPAVTGAAAVTYMEVSGSYLVGDTDDGLTAYTALDPDAADNNADTTWSVSGVDAAKFEIAANGTLTFKEAPDYEMPGDANRDNTYEVTVVAANGTRGTMDVKVMVENENEPGVVTLSRTQPRVGVPVKATLTDPDGSISGLRWQWYRDENLLTTENLPSTACADDTVGACVITGARSDTYTPTKGDENETLTAVATYTDGEDSDLIKLAASETAAQVAKDTRNRPPAFVDQNTDMDGIQNESTTRKVEENTKALVGTDADTADDDAIDDNSADNSRQRGHGPGSRPQHGSADLHAERCRCGPVQGEGQWTDRSGRRDEVGLRDPDHLHGHPDC